MQEKVEFASLLVNLRNGDSASSEALVSIVTPIILRSIRNRLEQANLPNLLDPNDICQAVLGSFFSKVNADWPTAKTMRELVALLLTIARNKVRDEIRRHIADRRDRRRMMRVRSNDHLAHLASNDPTPSKAIVQSELFEQAIKRLSPEERQILEERLNGRDWIEIAQVRGVSAELLRQKLNRAVHRVRRQLLAAARRGRSGPSEGA